MITRIELTNFMSHQHTVIEPAAGLTVLVGPNNVGKSAIVAALQILCHNDNSTYVTRHGEKECSVVVHTDDGHVIQWRRKNAPSYLIDGQTFDRLRGGGLPDELHQALRLPVVDAENDTDFDVHFGTQKSPIFLLNGSSSSAARFFASSSDAIRLVAMQRRHKEKLSEAQKEKNRLEALSKVVNAQLELLEPVVDVDRRLKLAEHLYEELTRLAVRLKEMERHAEALAEQLRARKHDQAQTTALSPLTAPPKLADLVPIETLIAQISTETRRREAIRLQSSALAVLLSPPSLQDVASLGQLTQNIATLGKATQRVSEERRTLANLANPPQLAETQTLQRLIELLAKSAQELEQSSRQAAALEPVAPLPDMQAEAPLFALQEELARTVLMRDYWKMAVAMLASATSPPMPSDITELERLVSQLDEVAKSREAQEAMLKTVDSDLKKVGDELRMCARGSLCPICGTPLDPEVVVQRAGLGLGGHEHA